MQVDMHYYATYALARAGGFTKEDSRIIATASQFVDDNAGTWDDEEILFNDGARLDVEPTAHHTWNWTNWTGWMRKHGLAAHQQRRVWVPFHFLPGGEGETYLTRMVCRKDSEIAREMVEHHLGKSDKGYYLPLLGIMAHVYADTFSHYGFSGVACKENEVKDDSLEILNKGDLPEGIRTHIEASAKSFREKYGHEAKGVRHIWANLKSAGAEAMSGGLGHGAVLTYPDRPYLVWEFEYEQQNEGGRRGRKYRDNPATFHEGARALHKAFSKAQAPAGGSKEVAKRWRDISEGIRHVIETPGKCKERMEEWQRLMETGRLSGERNERIPVYDGDRWNEQKDNLRDTASEDALDKPVYQFYQAAALHRVYVLRDLLPEHGIVGD